MKPSKALELLGAALTIVGSFLPWERGGGFLSPVANGLWIDFANFKYWMTGIHELPVYDYGGLLVVLLTLAIILLDRRPPKSIKHPELGALVISALLMSLSVFFVARGLFHVYEYDTGVEKPTFMIGLICVVTGAALLLWRKIRDYRQ